MSDFKNIVVRMPNWVGDVVMATPALRALRDRFPGAEITALALNSGEQILRGNPRLDRIEVYDRGDRDGGLFGMRRLIRRLKEKAFDLAIAFPNSFSSAWIFHRAKIPRRLGTDYGKRGWLLTDRFRPEMDGHRRVPKPMVEHFADLLEEIGVPRGSADLELTETDRGARRAMEALGLLGLNEADTVVAINPGASFGPSKIWPIERLAAVADTLNERHGLRPLLIGGPGEEPILRKIEAEMKTPALSTADELLDLDALKTAVRISSLMVTTDTGPRHYAVALGIPAVVLMGPTDPRYTASTLDRTTVLRVEDLECSPCHLKRCPLVHHACMTNIEPEQVLEACEALIARFPPRPVPPFERRADVEGELEEEGDRDGKEFWPSPGGPENP